MSNPATPRTVTLESEDFAADRFEITRVVGREAISDLYSYEISARLRDPDRAKMVDPDELLGATARLVFSNEAGFHIRTVFGVVESVAAAADGGTGAGWSASIVYRINILPKLSLLGLVTTQEVFLNMSVPEILAAKIERMAVGYAQFRTHAEYPKRDIVVQYKETDLAFIRRLAEHVGLAFHFEAGEQEEVVVFSDHQPGMIDHTKEAATFGPREESHAVHDLRVTSRVVPAVYAVQDYNYRKPQLDLGAVHEVPEGSGGMVEYGTHHRTPDEGEYLATVRADEARAKRRVFEGKGIALWFTAGGRFQLEHNPFHNEAGLVITRVEHRFDEPTFGGGKDAGGYENSFEAVSTQHPFRPARRTPQPRIYGILTAVVQADPGSAGREAKIDAEGRYIVQFHFDTADRTHGRASSPVRMAQPFAGPSQGMHFPLTPGTEVLIGFIDGDPDRPIILSALPNPVTPATVTAKDAHMHRIKSRHGLVVEFGATIKGS